MSTHELVASELTILESLVQLCETDVIELGCGAASFARAMKLKYPRTRYVGYEVDEIQLRRNLQEAPEGLKFQFGGAEKIAELSGSFDLALMLKSLHHIDVQKMDLAFSEVARVLRPGGHLYISEPVYDGALNEIVKLFNDEGYVRAQAQLAIDRAVETHPEIWREVAQRRFDMPVHFSDFGQFERRMMRPTFKDLGVNQAIVERVRGPFESHLGPDGAHFVRPMLVRLLRRET